MLSKFDIPCQKSGGHRAKPANQVVITLAAAGGASQGQASQRPAAESTTREAASGMDRRSSAEGLQGAADVLEQQHQMEGIRG